MIHRFTDTPEHQADTHAGAQQHRIPRSRGEFGLGIATADADSPEFTEREIECRQDENVGHQDQKPTGRSGYTGHRALEEAGGILLKHQRQQDEYDQGEGGKEGDMRVDIKA